MRHTCDMRTVRSISVAVALVALWLSAHAWGQSRGIEVAGEASAVHLYSQAYAVVIGIDRYENLPPGYDLSYAVGDARGVAETLESRFTSDSIITLYDEDATRDKILEILSAQLGETSEDDLVFIFWAGHAYTRETDYGDLGYLIPYDGTFDESEMTAKNISMTAIKEDISKAIPARHVFFVVDACYSGLLLTRDVIEEEPTHNLAYLRAMTKENVRQVLAAGTADQTVLDGGPRGHSVFTGRFIEALEEASDFVTATEITAKISRQVFSDAATRGHEQTPKGGRLFGLGDYVFVPRNAAQAEQVANEAAAATPQAPSSTFDERQMELAFWVSIKSSINPLTSRPISNSFHEGPLFCSPETG